MNLFAEEIEQQAITRIQKFAKIAKALKFEVCLGFSGGKDSQVCYDLCKRSGIPFKSYYNVAFESSVTKRFIREHYPDVIWRKDYKFGFIENIWKNHCGMLPTVFSAYCCSDYKHNAKYVDKCSILGIRKSESSNRSKYTTLMWKNKTVAKENKKLADNYFEEHCQSEGASSVIQLKPIIDWNDSDVWDYIHKYNLPVNPEYGNRKRVGCIVCLKANFTSNYAGLMKYPKLIDAFILAREKAVRNNNPIDWLITSDNKDYSTDKPYYICRWLNHSFMPFTKKQEELYRKVREKYDILHKNKQHEQKSSI